MRERLLADVRERVEGFAASRDAALVLSHEALAEAQALLAIAPDLDDDLEAAYLAGLLYCCRYLAADRDDDKQELAAALRLFRPVVRALPEAASGLVNDVLGRHRSRTAVDTMLTDIRANQQLRGALGTGDRDKLSLAVSGLRRVLDSSPPGHRSRARILATLNRALLARFEWTGERADLDAAIIAGRRAVLATPDGDARRAGRLAFLSMALRTRSGQAGHLADLAAAIGVARQAVRIAAAGHPDRVASLASLGLALIVRFERTGNLADLGEAISAFQDAVHSATADHPERATLLSNLCGGLRVRFEWTGDPMDLDAATVAGQDAVRATPPGHPRRQVRLSNLSLALRNRYELTGDLADMDAAISTGQEGVRDAPDGDPDRAGMLSNLSLALGSRYRRTGQPADLDATIAARLDVLRTSPADDPDRPGMLSNLGMALLVKSDRTGDHADLNAAVAAAQDAVHATPADHPDRAPRLSNLSTALLARFGRTGDHADLNAAIDAAQDAVHATPRDHTMHAGRLANLSVVLRTRFEHLGVPADIYAAVVAGQEAVGVVPFGHHRRAGMLSSLGNSLLARFDHTRDSADLDAAVAAGQDAVRATPLDHPDRAARLFNLSRSRLVRFERTEVAADLDAAITARQEAATSELAPPRVRAVAARAWGQASGIGQRWQAAMTGFETAIALLDRVAPRGMDRPDQEYVLEDVGSLASDAAACCVRAGLPGRAVELFEQGRGVLLGQALDTRTDLTTLAERYPALAEAFTTLRDELDQTGDPDGYPATAPAEMVGWDEPEPWLARRRIAVAAFDRVIADVRGKPGFANFLRPPSVTSLAEAAAEGPVVIINVSQFGSHALILTTGGVLDPVLLPYLTPDSVDEHVSEFLNALDEDRGSAEAELQLTAVLGWLWEAAAAPVLDRLGLTGPPPTGEQWPRLWWCVPGVLSFLPLHAAGYHGTRAGQAPQTVTDRVVSSYTPTIRALSHARRVRPADCAAPAGNEEVVVVAMPRTPGASDLPAAAAEANLLERSFPGRVRTLMGQAATRAAVLGALAEARWAHFACHGFADMANPSASHLLLTDHHLRPLSVTDVARLRLNDADLAFLSGCSTARPSPRLTDEAIHLASAFQLAGYRHVIGTLWPVGDRPAVRLASTLYGVLASSGTADSAPVALHTATRQLRDLYERTPSAWASHIHSGP